MLNLLMSGWKHESLGESNRPSPSLGLIEVAHFLFLLPRIRRGEKVGKSGRYFETNLGEKVRMRGPWLWHDFIPPHPPPSPPNSTRSHGNCLSSRLRVPFEGEGNFEKSQLQNLGSTSPMERGNTRRRSVLSLETFLATNVTADTMPNNGLHTSRPPQARSISAMVIGAGLSSVISGALVIATAKAGISPGVSPLVVLIGWVVFGSLMKGNLKSFLAMLQVTGSGGAAVSAGLIFTAPILQIHCRSNGTRNPRGAHRDDVVGLFGG